MKTPQSRLFSLPAFIILIILAAGSCKKITTPVVTVTTPTVNTADVIINATSTTAQSGGSITALGGSYITANGVCYSTTNKTPTTADSKTSDPLVAGAARFDFTSSLKGLTANTLY